MYAPFYLKFTFLLVWLLQSVYCSFVSVSPRSFCPSTESLCWKLTSFLELNINVNEAWGTNCLSGPVLLSLPVNMPAWPRGFTLLLSSLLMNSQTSPWILLLLLSLPFHCFFLLPFLWLVVNRQPWAFFPNPPPPSSHCFYPIIKNKKNLNFSAFSVFPSLSLVSLQKGT